MPPVSPTAREHDGSDARGPGPGADGAPRVRRPARGTDGEGRSGGGPLRAVLDAARGLARDRVVLAGLLVVAVAVALRVHVLNESHFVEDDYLFFANADVSDLGPDYLFSLHKGHLMPGALFLVYLQTAFWPYAWWVSAGAMLALQTVAQLGFLRLVWELFGRRWALLVPLTVYALAPLTVPVLGWWAAALNAVPLQLAMVLAVLWTVRYLRTGDQRLAWWAGAAVVFGMLFTVKAMFLPLVLFAVAVAHLYPGGLVTGARRAWILHRPFWTVMGLLLAAYTAFYLVRTRAAGGGEGAGVPQSEPALAMLRGLLTEVFPVGALGGPPEWGPVTPTGGLIDPSGVVVLGSWAVFAVIVLVSMWMRRGAWRAWVLLLAYLVVVDVIPTIIARGRFQDVAAADPRYVADAAPVFALCLALAYLPTREERARASVGGASPEPVAAPHRVRPRRGLRIAALLATVAYVAAAGHST
uniref:membrane protein n=1 Tax=Nocardiopsis halotolerans TaxID=124252 RepID=UPI000594A125